MIGPVRLISSGLAWLSLTEDQQRKQSRFAQAVALTKTAQLVRAEVRKLAARTFTIRAQAFTMGGIQIQRAEVDSDSPVATLFGGPGYLTPHATDVPKEPGPGRHEFGVPLTGSGARPSFPEKVPAPLRLSKIGEALTALPPLIPKKRRGKPKAGPPFLLELGAKRFIVRRRAQPMKGKRLEFLFLMEEQPIDLPDIYPFQEVAQREASRLYSTQLAKAYLDALSSAR